MKLNLMNLLNLKVANVTQPFDCWSSMWTREKFVLDGPFPSVVYGWSSCRVENYCVTIQVFVGSCCPTCPDDVGIVT